MKKMKLCFFLLFYSSAFRLLSKVNLLQISSCRPFYHPKHLFVLLSLCLFYMFSFIWLTVIVSIAAIIMFFRLHYFFGGGGEVGRQCLMRFDLFFSPDVFLYYIIPNYLTSFWLFFFFLFGWFKKIHYLKTNDKIFEGR